jgi:hypothetical protein
MTNLTTATLRRALDLQVKIESMQRELASILGSNVSLSSAASMSNALTTGPRRRGRKPGRPATKAPVAARGPRKKRVSPLKGKKRPASPSGPLAPAVVKVMKRAGGPLSVDAVLKGLAQDKYVWNVSDPKKNLAARIYKLAGVKKVGPGKFGLANTRKK